MSVSLSGPATPVDVLANVASATAEAIKLAEQRSAAANTPDVVAGNEAVETAKLKDQIAKDITDGNQKAEELDDD